MSWLVKRIYWQAIQKIGRLYVSQKPDSKELLGSDCRKIQCLSDCILTVYLIYSSLGGASGPKNDFPLSESTYILARPAAVPQSVPLVSMIRRGYQSRLCEMIILFQFEIIESHRKRNVDDNGNKDEARLFAPTLFYPASLCVSVAQAVCPSQPSHSMYTPTTCSD